MHYFMTTASESYRHPHYTPLEFIVKLFDRIEAGGLKLSTFIVNLDSTVIVSTHVERSPGTKEI